MADVPASFTTRAVTAGLLAIAASVAACADSSGGSYEREALALLRSAEPAARHEAVVILGMLPPSEARHDGLVRAIRDSDEKVRLMAGIVVFGDGPAAYARWAEPRTEDPAPSGTPNPAPRADLTTVEWLVYLDPWFAGTLIPGALLALKDEDERVRVLGERALRYAKGVR